MCIRDSLRPSFTEHELVLKLSYHFDRHIRLAVYTQGVKTIEELLILVMQSSQFVNKQYERRETLPQQQQYSTHNPIQQKSTQFEKKGLLCMCLFTLGGIIVTLVSLCEHLSLIHI